ncbi:histidine kinase [Pseudoduganella flava]|uniref:Histidine kinase n=2 Tax=Pseudoduganella flava TaxID=871742 RepID=A0A562PMY7_9BURK|nr:histidine kinase [Pseudoduganella flava]
MAVHWLQSVAAPGEFPYDAGMTESTNNFATTARQAALGWLALGLVDGTQVVVSMRAMGMHHAWVTLFVVTVASWAVWAAFTPVPLALLRRFPLPSRRVAAWLVHGVACLAIGVLWAAWAALLEHETNPYAYPEGPDPFLPLLRSKLLANLIGDVVLYGAIVALHAALEARARLLHQRAASARLAELLAQAQLAALRVQLEPHFLFNSLNAITALIRVNKGDEAIALTAALGDLLRRVTDRSERQLVTIEEELDFIRNYLDVQRIRFAERLRYRIDVPDSLKSALVPDFIVQPLVENAIKHGIAKRAKGGELTVAASADGGTLTLSVYNDGPPLPASWREGVGLANTRQRLRALYGGAEALTLRNEAAAGVLATLTLPLTLSDCPA